MKTTVDIPDDVASAVQRSAEQDGRAVAEQIVRLVKLGLIASALPMRDLEKMLSLVRSSRNGGAHVSTPFSLTTDTATGLPAIHSPPEAPIFSMSPVAILALMQLALSEEDLERAGLPLGH